MARRSGYKTAVAWATPNGATPGASLSSTSTAGPGRGLGGGGATRRQGQWCPGDRARPARGPASSAASARLTSWRHRGHERAKSAAVPGWPPAGAATRPDGRDGVLWYVSHYGLNPEPVVIALAKAWTDPGRVLITTSFRGHPRRPHLVDHRLLATAGNPIQHLPRHQRLRSIGLDTLADWASIETLNTGRQDEGHRDRIDVAFWRDGVPRSGVALGPVRWQALRLRNSGLLLAVLDTRQVHLRWHAPRTPPARQAPSNQCLTPRADSG